MEKKVINNVDLDDLDLSVRAWNCLRRAMINNVQDIVDNINVLPKVRNLGKKCYDEVLEKIKPYIEEVDRICITNYDRIKSMSVEEMAESIAALTGDLIVRDMIRGFVKNETAIEAYKQWLLQEVSDDKY